MPDTVRLRAHHLLCILPFIGKGYTPDFVENFTSVVAKIISGSEIHLVAGVDDICAAMHGKDGPLCPSGEHCLKDSAHQRDREALSAISRNLQIDMAVDSTIRLKAEHYQTLRNLFAAGIIRKACAGCEWHELCTTIADNGFKGAKLMPEAVPRT